MPKLILNASGDQFFLPDSSQFYFDGLPGEKHLRYVPNTDHSLSKSDALESIHAFYASIVTGTPRPGMKWSFERDGSIKVVTKQLPAGVKVWQAVNPEARSFRLDRHRSGLQGHRLDAFRAEYLGRAGAAAVKRLDGVFHRADLPERREVPVQGDDGGSCTARHAAIRCAEREGRGGACGERRRRCKPQDDTLLIDQIQASQ